MYAVFRSGGKQYRGKEGDKIKLEKINADEGSSVQFDEVMILGEGDNIKIGTPYIPKTSVQLRLQNKEKAKKFQ